MYDSVNTVEVLSKSLANSLRTFNILNANAEIIPLPATYTFGLHASKIER